MKPTALTMPLSWQLPRINLRTPAKWSVRPAFAGMALAMLAAGSISLPITVVLIDSARCQPPYRAGELIQTYVPRAQQHRQEHC